jgi:sugar O-acyltransferase (sialic acid O-acetyltransferase NeuD family)
MPEFRPIVLYGNGKLAELVLQAFAGDERYRFCAVTADRSFIAAADFRGLPLLPFETLAASYPPEAVDLLVAVGYRRMRARREMFDRAKAAGYRLANCVARGARVYPDLVLGENNIISDLAYVGPNSRLGSNNVVRPQTYLGHDVVVGDHAFVASGVSIGGDCRIGSLSFVGLGATITDGRTIADECLIGAGALVVGDTLPCGCYLGHPAKRVRELAETGVVLA